MPSDWRDKGRQRVKDKSEGGSLKLVPGENCLRIMPDKKDLTPEGKLKTGGITHPPMREFRIHEDWGPDHKMAACGKDIEGVGKCWACDVKLPDLAKKKPLLARKRDAREKFVVQAALFNSETGKYSAPKPWWVSTGAGIPGRQQSSLAVRVYSKIVSSKKDYVDPIKGYNLNITKTGEGLKTRYPEVEGDESPSKVPLSVLAQVKDLDTLIPQYNEEEMKRLYFGKPSEREEQADRPRGRGRDAEDEDEDEETSEEDEETSEEGEEEGEEESSEEEGEAAEEESESEEASEEEEGEEESSEEEYGEDEGDEEGEDSEEEAEETEDEEEEKPKPAKKTTTKKTAPPAKKGAVAKKAPPPAAKKKK